MFRLFGIRLAPRFAVEGSAMTTRDSRTFASNLATFVRLRMAEVPRSALVVRCTRDGSMLGAVFGNDHYLGNHLAKKEVGLIRQQLRDAGIEELGFGISHDGQSWALLVRTDFDELKTNTAKTFRTEMYRSYLEELVWAAWRAACGAPAEEARWPVRIIEPVKRRRNQA
jgi:hypothetical protein